MTQTHWSLNKHWTLKLFSHLWSVPSRSYIQKKQNLSRTQRYVTVKHTAFWSLKMGWCGKVQICQNLWRELTPKTVASNFVVISEWKQDKNWIKLLLAHLQHNPIDKMSRMTPTIKFLTSILIICNQQVLGIKILILNIQTFQVLTWGFLLFKTAKDSL